MKGLSSDIKGETKTAIEMLIDIFKKEAASTTDDQRAVVAKAAKTKDNTKASNQISDLVLPDDIGDDNLQSSPNIAISHGGQI